MKITEYPEATTLTESDLALIDSEDGTQKITAPNLANSLVDLMETNKVVSNLDLESLPEAFSVANDDVFMIGSPNNITRKLKISSDILFDIIDPIISVEMRRNIWRGKNLGYEFGKWYRNAVNNGTFKGLFIGDYFPIIVNGTTYNFRIVDFDYWYAKGGISSTRINQHHIVVMPDEILFNLPYNAIGLWDDGGTTLFKNYIRPFYNAIKGNTFYGYILNIPTLLPVSFVEGAPVEIVWKDLQLIIPKEIMLFGTSINGATNDGRVRIQKESSDGLSSISQRPTNESTTEWSQLSAFKINPMLAIGEGIGSYWLDDLHNQGDNHNSHSSFDELHGIVGFNLDSISNVGIRPIMAIY